MPTADRIKEELGWLKVVFTVSVALAASLIGWLAQNYHTKPIVILAMGGVGAIFWAAVAASASRRVYRCLHSLEDM